MNQIQKTRTVYQLKFSSYKGFNKTRKTPVSSQANKKTNSRQSRNRGNPHKNNAKEIQQNQKPHGTALQIEDKLEELPRPPKAKTGSPCSVMPNNCRRDSVCRPANAEISKVSQRRMMNEEYS